MIGSMQDFKISVFPSRKHSFLPLDWACKDYFLWIIARDNFGTISDNVAVMLDTESLIAENISNQSPLLPAPELFGLLIGNLYKIQRDSISSDCASQEEPSSGRH
jgi:hypothetical protein